MKERQRIRDSWTVSIAIGLATFLGAIAAPIQVHAQNKDEAKIKALEDNLAGAVKAKDVDAVMKCYQPGADLLVFDVIPPREYVGADAYRKDWQGVLSSYDGPVTWDLSEEKISNDGKLGYVTYISHFSGKNKQGQTEDTTFRVTDVVRKNKGKWLIVHEHLSVPVDLSTAKADLTSKP